MTDRKLREEQNEISSCSQKRRNINSQLEKNCSKPDFYVRATTDPFKVHPLAGLVQQPELPVLEPAPEVGRDGGGGGVQHPGHPQGEQEVEVGRSVLGADKEVRGHAADLEGTKDKKISRFFVPFLIISVFTLHKILEVEIRKSQRAIFELQSHPQIRKDCENSQGVVALEERREGGVENAKYAIQIISLFVSGANSSKNGLCSEACGVDEIAAKVGAKK